MIFADVIIDISHEAVDRPFTYGLTEDLEPAVIVGSVVNVPFGRGNSLKRGYVIGLRPEVDFPKEKIKYIQGIVGEDISIESQLIALAFWMAKTYGSTMAAALRTVLSVNQKTKLPKKRTVSIKDQEIAAKYLSDMMARSRHSIPKERLLKELLEEGILPWEMVTGKLNIPSSVIRDLEKNGILDVLEEDKHYSPKDRRVKTDTGIELNPEQKSAVETFVSDWQQGDRKVYLVHGITGSGKTEVYIRMLETVIAAGKDAIVLIPEISLTYQTLMRFYRRFGDMVSVINSRLSQGERYDIYERAKRGDIRIIIGPRSALFSPFKNLGIIIMDEEHEGSYKSEKTPRYHARDCAIKRAELAGAAVVLGSATPSVDSYYNASLGKYKLLTLKNRAGSAIVPSVEVVDLRGELKAGNRSVISRRLFELIEEALAKDSQVMLFINRRGMLATVSCRSCGEVIKCPHCDVSLSLHRDKRLYCHYCGYSTEALDRCPSCGSSYIGGFKAGTEKIEQEVLRLFPGARVVRMDADSTKGKDGHEKVLSVFANKGADILIGTQMIVKGHDFPEVSLVGILAADLSLNTNDYRSAERTFDLITQACGRAGRGEIEGRAVIQTYRPDHYAVSCAAAMDYEGFYQKEIAYRSLLSYPPVGHMLLVMMHSRKEDLLLDFAKRVKSNLAGKLGDIWMSDSVTPSVSRIQDVYRRIIYFKTGDIDEIERVRDLIEPLADAETEVSVYYDTDPQSMF